MAEVSGPGKFSERTDKAVSAANRSLPDAGYGEQAAYQDQLSGAPMAASSPVDFSALFGDPASRVIGLGEPSMEPGTPVTDGAAMGAGRGTEALPASDTQERAALLAYLPALEFMANQPGSPDSARNIVRQIKYNL